MSSMDFANAASGMDRSGEKHFLGPHVVKCLSSVFALGLRQFFGQSQQGLVVGRIIDPAGTLDHAAKKFNDLRAAPLRRRSDRQ